MPSDDHQQRIQKLEQQVQNLQDQLNAIIGLPPGVTAQPVRRAASPSSQRAEEDAIFRHYERFSEQFRRVDTSKDDLLRAFRASRGDEPGLTARQFLASPRGKLASPE